MIYNEKHSIVDCFIASRLRVVFHCLMHEGECGWKTGLGQDIACLRTTFQFESLPNPKSKLPLVKTSLTGLKLLLLEDRILALVIVKAIQEVHSTT